MKSFQELGEIMVKAVDGNLDSLRRGYGIVIADVPTDYELKIIGEVALSYGDITVEGTIN